MDPAWVLHTAVLLLVTALFSWCVVTAWASLAVRRQWVIAAGPLIVLAATMPVHRAVLGAGDAVSGVVQVGLAAAALLVGGVVEGAIVRRVRGPVPAPSAPPWAHRWRFAPRVAALVALGTAPLAVAVPALARCGDATIRQAAAPSQVVVVAAVALVAWIGAELAWWRAATVRALQVTGLAVVACAGVAGSAVWRGGQVAGACAEGVPAGLVTNGIGLAGQIGALVLALAAVLCLFWIAAALVGAVRPVMPNRVPATAVARYLRAAGAERGGQAERLVRYWLAGTRESLGWAIAAGLLGSSLKPLLSTTETSLSHIGFGIGFLTGLVWAEARRPYLKRGARRSMVFAPRDESRYVSPVTVWATRLAGAGALVFAAFTAVRPVPDCGAGAHAPALIAVCAVVAVTTAEMVRRRAAVAPLPAEDPQLLAVDEVLRATAIRRVQWSALVLILTGLGSGGFNVVLPDCGRSGWIGSVAGLALIAIWLHRMTTVARPRRSTVPVPA